MKRHLSFSTITSLIIVLHLFSLPFAVHAQSADPVVRAVLFYSPTCPHCAKVIQEDLPPLLEKYGVQLEIVGIDASQIEGGTLYQAAVQRFQIPENRLGVPTLIIDETVLVGSLEIPEQLPGLIEHHLAQGGVDWPDIPGLTETLAASTPGQPEDHPVEPTIASSAHLSLTPEPASSPQGISPTQTIPATLPTPIPTQISSGLSLPDDHDLSWQEKFIRDPAGNTLSVLVLLGMLGALLGAVLYFIRGDVPSQGINAHWLIPILCLVGFFVAGYLAYVETAQVSAVCGPVGDCNTVQQSEYARLFGILPIGTLGLVGYLTILLAWLGARLGRNGVENLGALALLGMTFAGTLFSIYLTFLEPFVIGATCAWCLTSAVLMTVLMLLSLGPGKSAYLVYVRNRRL
ncbi:MAG: vitamin K epoxide reductase family protein [Anaerolineales bacterium]